MPLNPNHPSIITSSVSQITFCCLQILWSSYFQTFIYNSYVSHLLSLFQIPLQLVNLMVITLIILLIPFSVICESYCLNYCAQDCIAVLVDFLWLAGSKISQSRFLAECHKRRLNQGSFVLLYFTLYLVYFPVLFCLSVPVQ